MVVIRSLETAVPLATVRQDAMRDLLRRQPGYGRLGERLITAAFDGSEIDTRHSVLAELDSPARLEGGDGAQDPGGSDPSSLYDAASGTLQNPGTAARNDAYALHSKPLLVDAARRALASAEGIGEADVTHVITVSCTGFYAPGPDYVLVRDLGLAPSTQRYHLGFMGCYAAFPALRLAAQLCAADPSAVVLVVSVELCSLHLHVDDDPDAIVAASVFGDGAAAAVVTGDGRPAPAATPYLELDAFETTIIPEGIADMAWTIGDHGFDMVLSSYVPKIVEKNIGAALAPLFRHVPGLEMGDVPLWAVHPGGRSILDRVEQALSLTPSQLEPSRRVLREHGNMSSASVLFVLRELLAGSAAESRSLQLVDVVAGRAEESVRAGETSSTMTVPPDPEPARIGAMAFGPGLTVETALLTLRPALARRGAL